MVSTVRACLSSLGLVLGVGCCQARAQVVVLPRDFSTTQGEFGLRYVSVGDTRPGNTLNPGPDAILPLDYRGFVDQGNQAGESYAKSGDYPEVLYDSSKDVLFLHPGTGGFSLGAGTANLGVGVEWTVALGGLYRPVNPEGIPFRNPALDRNAGLPWVRWGMEDSTLKGLRCRGHGCLTQPRWGLRAFRAGAPRVALLAQVNPGLRNGTPLAFRASRSADLPDASPMKRFPS